MKWHKATVGRKGQVTVPSEVRRSMGLGSGDDVAFVQDDTGVLFTRWIGVAERTAGTIEHFGPPVSLEEGREAFAHGVAEQVIAGMGGGNGRRAGWRSADQVKVIQWRIAETIAWRELHSGPGYIRDLRDPSLRPASFQLLQTALERRRMVEILAWRRADFLRMRRQYPRRPTTDLAGGRLILYAPDQTLSEGASELASSGYLNVDDEPAWDMWLAYMEDHLIAWVPPDLVAAVDGGVLVNSTGCLISADDIDAALALRYVESRGMWRDSRTE